MNLLTKLSSKRLLQRSFKCMIIRKNNYSSAKFNQLLIEAEKEIRVSLSQFDVRHLLRDEFDLRIFTINKVNTKYISESNHPIVDIAKDMFGSDERRDNDRQFKDSATLLLLLLAKVSESLPSFKSSESIIKRQHHFVEIFQMISKALFIHHVAVVNIPTDTISRRPDLKRLNDANKISILGGDYLLSYAIVRLTNLINNTTILQLIMCAIDDFCIGHFNRSRDGTDDHCIPSNNMSVLDWEEMAGYSLTKLIAYCSQIILLLAEQSDRYQKSAFDLGYNLQLIWNLKEEIECFTAKNRADSGLKLMSAPVIFHMQYDKNFHIYLKKQLNSGGIDSDHIRQMVINGPAIDECNRCLESYANKAIKSLNVFPKSNAKSILENAIFI